MLLSIIVPFYNSALKCQRLLATLANLEASDVELVFVDDGSTDDTLAVLDAFRKVVKLPLNIIPQGNRGPGGARNKGLRAAHGQYVWFVDSDDNIHPGAIDVLRSIACEGFDFVDFDLVADGRQIDSMGCGEGVYTDEELVKKLLLNNFGRIWSKVIRRGLLIDNDIYYPEFCIYEDNPLIFLYPFYVKSFKKCGVVGYYHQIEHESVTRAGISSRYYDRLHTAASGLNYGLQLCSDASERRILMEKFRNLYLINTVCMLIAADPIRNLLAAVNVANSYRELIAFFDYEESFSHTRCVGQTRRQLVVWVVWLISYFIGSDPAFLERHRMAAWNRGFDWSRGATVR